MEQLTLAICTKDRPADLTRLLHSVARQTRPADSILIIDGSDQPIKHLLDDFPTLPLEYHAVRPPSLPRQRNVAISKLDNPQAWVGFLDDDLELKSSALEEVEKFVQHSTGDKPLGGVGLSIEEPFPGRSRWRNLFFLDKYPGGRFTQSGCASFLRPFEHDQEVQWLRGGATFWKAEVFGRHHYDEWFEGTGYHEDIDFSYRAAKDYRLCLAGAARCLHHSHPVRKEKVFALGVWQLTAWWYFARKTGAFRSPLVLWGMLGVTLNNLALGLLRPRGQRWRKGLGNIKGLGLILTGQALKKSGFFR